MAIGGILAMIGSTFVLDGWSVDAARGMISQGDENIRPEPQVMKVLAYLAERPGVVVSRDELFKELWGGAFV